MQCFPRYCLLSTAVLALVLLAISLGQRLSNRAASADLRELIRRVRRGEELEQFLKAVYRHRESKEHVVQEVIAQRCRLNEALARWQELDRQWLQELEREWPDSAIGIAEMYRQAWADADYYYRNITKLAAELLRDRPAEAAAVLRRLEKDYQQLQADRQTPSTALTARTEPNR